MERETLFKNQEEKRRGRKKERKKNKRVVVLNVREDQLAARVEEVQEVEGEVDPVEVVVEAFDFLSFDL